MNLFNEPETIRTLGFYQPWGSLMLHGKIETRKVKIGKKPPFPKGKYLFYTTKLACPNWKVFDWCGPEIFDNIITTLKDEPTKELSGWAIAVGELKKAPWVMNNKDEARCFVANKDEQGKSTWCLEFENIQRIEPFEFLFGKQGVGILPISEHSKIIPANTDIGIDG